MFKSYLLLHAQHITSFKYHILLKASLKFFLTQRFKHLNTFVQVWEWWIESKEIKALKLMIIINITSSSSSSISYDKKSLIMCRGSNKVEEENVLTNPHSLQANWSLKRFRFFPNLIKAERIKEWMQAGCLCVCRPTKLILPFQIKNSQQTSKTISKQSPTKSSSEPHTQQSLFK